MKLTVGSWADSYILYLKRCPKKGIFFFMDTYKVSYHDPKSILIINSRGKIRRLYTPFKVFCIKATDAIKEGTIVYVEEVATNEKGQLLYITNSGIYAHSCFRIMASF